MTDEQSPHLPVIESWDSYWQGAQTSGAYTGGGSSHPLVTSFWTHFFVIAKSGNSNPKIIDIASGNGAVIECANRVFEGRLPEFTCLDVSKSAIRILEERFPGVQGIVADAASIPLHSASFDIATSQFGVEYAGREALDELARLIASGGELALLLHHRGGTIYEQCTANLDATRQMQAAEFIPKCIAMFEAGFSALQGGDRTNYSKAGKQFAPAIKAMEAILARYGGDAADGTILRLYRDVRTIHDRMRHYEASDVIGWLNKLQKETEAYAGRMASMLDAAIDDDHFRQLCTDLAEQGFEVLRAEPLASADQASPLAWVLVAKKN
jgi:ubiquinone/menaquinone biosynthesis C-methylase UbiE